MSDKAKKIIVLAIVIGISFGMLWVMSSNQNNDLEVRNESNKLVVTFLDVSKGDCILIQDSNQTIMIDTGYEENGEDIVQWLKDRNIEALSYLILTHPDKDHIGGADHVISNIKVGKVIQTDCVVESDDYQEYQQAAKEEGVLVETLKETKEINLLEAKLTIYPPISTDFQGQNDYSLVAKLIYKNTSFLFTGDAMEARIDELLTQIPDLKSTVLKVPHHGTLMDNSEEFFEAVSPSVCIITSDKKKMYQDVKKILEDLKASIYVTKNGDIEVISDGEHIKMKQ